MERELTITIDEQVYHALSKIADQQDISRFIEMLLRPYANISSLGESYQGLSDKDQAFEQMRKMIVEQYVNQIVVDLLRTQKLRVDLEAGYRAMAADEEYEEEAMDWIEGTIGDAFDETR